MESIHYLIEQYMPLNQLEIVLKYLYENDISFDAIDQHTKEIDKLIQPAAHTAKKKIRQNLIAFLESVANYQAIIPGEFLIPKGMSMYIQKFPRYLQSNKHSHNNAMEINIVLKGEFCQIINGNKIELQSGDICFLAPNVPHATLTDNDDTIVLSILIFHDALRDVMNEINNGANQIGQFLKQIFYGGHYYPFLLCRTGFDNDIVGMVIDIEHMQHNKSEYINKYLESCLHVFLLRLLIRHESGFVLGNIIERNDSGIMNLLEYMEANIKTVSLESLSKTFNYSVSYLSVLIKEQYGKSFTELTTDIRMKNAVRLLETTDLSMSKIAEAVGYSDKSYFLKRFRAKYNMTPSEFRKIKSCGCWEKS